MDSKLDSMWQTYNAVSVGQFQNRLEKFTFVAWAIRFLVITIFITLAGILVAAI